MRVPAKLSGDKPAISVWLDNTTEDIEKKFHCVVCGKVVFEYFNSVQMILPGTPGHLRSPKVVQCFGMIDVKTSDNRTIATRCKTKYYVT